MLLSGCGRVCQRNAFAPLFLCARRLKQPCYQAILQVIFLFFEFETLATSCVNQTSTVRPTLPLVLLLREALALCDDQFLVRALGVVVWDECIAGKVGVDLGIGLDALEAILDVALLGPRRIC
jgi:hypothetical protein